MKIVGSITDHDRLNTLYMLTVSSLDDCKERRWTEAPWHCWTYKEKKTDHVTQIHFFCMYHKFIPQIYNYTKILTQNYIKCYSTQKWGYFPILEENQPPSARDPYLYMYTIASSETNFHEIDAVYTVSIKRAM